jgi:hypothetical protein
MTKLAYKQYKFRGPVFFAANEGKQAFEIAHALQNALVMTQSESRVQIVTEAARAEMRHSQRPRHLFFVVSGEIVFSHSRGAQVLQLPLSRHSRGAQVLQLPLSRHCRV